MEQEEQSAQSFGHETSSCFQSIKTEQDSDQIELGVAQDVVDSELQEVSSLSFIKTEPEDLDEQKDFGVEQCDMNIELPELDNVEGEMCSSWSVQQGSSVLFANENIDGTIKLETTDAILQDQIKTEMIFNEFPDCKQMEEESTDETKDDPDYEDDDPDYEVDDDVEEDPDYDEEDIEDDDHDYEEEDNMKDDPNYEVDRNDNEDIKDDADYERVEEPDGDFDVEFDCRKCARTFGSFKSLEKHYKSCVGSIQLSNLFETVVDDSEKVKCKLCGKMVRATKTVIHKRYFHDAMVLMFLCSGKKCTYVSHTRNNLALHVNRRHANENISLRKEDLERKFVPNPKLNSAMYAINKTKGKRVDENGKVRLYACPKCQFQSSAHRNVRSHMLCHKKDMDSDEFSKFVSNEIPKVYIEKEKVHDGKLLTNDCSRKRKRKRKNCEQLQLLCCGKTFKTKVHYQEHYNWFHKTQVNMFLCPVPGCSIKNVLKHKLKSHIVVKHARRLLPDETENYLKDENILSVLMPNPKYIPAEMIDINKEKEADPSKKFKCDKCGKGYKEKKYLDKHLREFHDPNFIMQKCPVTDCSYETRTVYNLKDHIMRHVNREEITREQMDEMYEQLPGRRNRKQPKPATKRHAKSQDQARSIKTETIKTETIKIENTN